MCEARKNIDVTISDGTILTPRACSRIVSEIIKCLVYQKSQIPYPFNHLKKSVLDKRKVDNERCADQPSRSNFTVVTQFRAASKAFDDLEDIFVHLERELCNQDSRVVEVAVVFGLTYHLAKQSYRILIPTLQYYHNEDVHGVTTQKNVNKTLRNILFSDDWTESISTSLPKTNMYVLLKKLHSASADDYFHPVEFDELRGRVTAISISYDALIERNCCDKLSIFGLTQNIQCDDETDNTRDLEKAWYLASTVFKGFGDVYVNKVSVSDLW